MTESHGRARAPHPSPHGGASREHEVVVVGAGPAGSAAAIILARRAHDVALVRPSSTPHGALSEAVPPSARQLLTEIGALEALERAAFHPNGGNTVWWAGRPAREESFADGARGFHVDRRGLEDVLVAVAAASGAKVYDGVAVRSVHERPDGWTVTCEGEDRSGVELSTAWVVDATGRRGVLARREGRQYERDTTTLSLLGRWRKPAGWDRSKESHTLVESYPSGWAWSVPMCGDVRCFSAMVDHRHEALAGSDVAEMLRVELAKTTHIRRMLEDAEPEGGCWACPASLYHARRYARPGLLLAGDAGSFIDPLSSYGVKKALASGWLAAVVAHTALVDPGMESVAIDLFDRREKEVYLRYRAVSAPYFVEAADAYAHRYWRTRAAGAESGDGTPGAGPDPDTLDAGTVPEEDVRAAFEVMRTRERLDAVRGPSLRTIERAAVDGYRVVLDSHLASDAYPEGMRFVRSVDLRRLVELAERHDDVAELWTAYNGVAPPVPLPDFVTALATVFAAGFLSLADA